MTDEPRSEWSLAVVQVDGGRGTVVETESGERYVITAAHCLPNLPPSHGASHTEERTYGKLLGKLGAEPTVSAECLFADPVADLAVLCMPDNQDRYDEANAYEALLDAARPLPVGSLTYVDEIVTLSDGRRVPRPPRAESAAWVLSLDGQWFACHVRSGGKTLLVENAAQPIQGGMSGSPIIAPDGTVIGVISTGEAPNPELAADLPAWILRAIRADR